MFPTEPVEGKSCKNTCKQDKQKEHWSTSCPTVAKRTNKQKKMKWVINEGLCLRVINEAYPPLKRNHSPVSFFTLSSQG